MRYISSKLLLLLCEVHGPYKTLRTETIVSRSVTVRVYWTTLKLENETVNPKCAALCEPTGGVSCSKTLLVDVYSKRSPRLTKRVYAIVDEQSNSSFASSELADDLAAGGLLEKYFQSTCSG